MAPTNADWREGGGSTATGWRGPRCPISGPRKRSRRFIWQWFSPDRRRRLISEAWGTTGRWLRPSIHREVRTPAWRRRGHLRWSRRPPRPSAVQPNAMRHAVAEYGSRWRWSFGLHLGEALDRRPRPALGNGVPLAVEHPHRVGAGDARRAGCGNQSDEAGPSRASLRALLDATPRTSRDDHATLGPQPRGGSTVPVSLTRMHSPG